MFIKNSTPPDITYEPIPREHILVDIYDSNRAGGMSGTVLFYRDRSLDGSFLQIGWKASNGFKCWTGTITPDVGTHVGNEPLVSYTGTFGTVSFYSGFIPELTGTKPVAAKDRGLLAATKLSTPTEYRARVPNTYALRMLPSMDHDLKNAKERNTSWFEYKDALFALDASKGTTDLVAGRTASIFGYGEVLQNGEFCFDNVRGLRYTLETGTQLDALKDFTFELDYTITSDPGWGYWGYYGNKGSWSSMCICAQWMRDGYRPSMFWNGYYDTTTGGPDHPEYVNDGIYHHLAWVRKGDVTTLYNDGIATISRSGVTADLRLTIENQLCVGWQDVEDACLPGRMKHFKITPEALYTTNFEEELPKWVGI